MKKLSKFTIGLIAYIAVLVILIVVLLVYTSNSMKKYEASQPDKVMEQLITDMKAGKLPEMLFGASSKFEDIEGDVLAKFSNLDNATITYDIKYSGYDASSYNLKINDEKVATVNLKASNHKEMFFLLVVCDWKVESVEPVVEAGTNEVTVTVPSDYTVAINGVVLTEAEMQGEPAPLEELKYVETYTTVPSFTTYKVSGLVNEPKVSVVDSQGTMKEIPYAKEINLTYEAQEMPEDLKTYVLQAAKDYSNFFSKDLPGCSTSTAGIDKYFPQGSMYIELAENYRLHDMWMYSAHHGTEIYNEVVDEYVVYSDELFACNVSFEKKMILTATGDLRTDSMNQTFYYVKIDGEWLIAAMIDNVE